MRGPYEFNQKDAYDFARFIGYNARQKGDELNFNICPYCHGGSSGKDKNTFSINLNTGQFKCLRSSCGASGNMVTLSKDFDFSLGSEMDEYYKPKKQYKSFGKREKPIEPKPEAIQYLESRGISEAVAKEYEITVQTDKPNILVFPFYDDKGGLQFIKYRKIDYDKRKDKNKEWCEANGKPILFGMKQCKDFSRLVITEGQMDSLSVATAGIDNAASVPTGAKGFTWVPYCWDWINRFEEIIVFGDHENGKITLLDEICARFKRKKVRHVREEDYIGCKDANDILRKYGPSQVRKCVENAVLIPVKGVISLSDVVSMDPYSIPKVPSGIKEIDRILYGGVPLGGLVLVTGKTGCGKSTFASQFLINAAVNNYKCFAYSGELTNSQFRFGMDFQLAGSQYISEYQNRWGDTNYTLDNDAKSSISSWYSGKIWLYDNSMIDGDERDGLIKIVENVITQYGINVILIDNLMTAMSMDLSYGSDKYEKQGFFVNALAKMANRYNVAIFLVAHKRKNNFSSNENDEISGSGDISNLASVIFSYDSDKDIEPSQRLCKITKNRLFGKTELNGYVLDYDEKSRRIYGRGDDLYVDYGWNKNKNGFVSVNDETPFE